jgi:hypothetical protein
MFHVRFTNLTSMVGVQLNSQLLKVMLRCVNDGVKTMKHGDQTTGNVYVVWSDESTFTLFSKSGGVYVWRTPEKAYNLECLVPTAKHREGSAIVWAAILWYSVGPIITLHGRTTAREYVDRCILRSRRYF